MLRSNPGRCTRCAAKSVAVGIALLCIGAAGAQPAAPVRFAKLFSSLDGAFQAVELDIDGAGGAPLRLGGRKLALRDAAGRERSVVLPATHDGPVKGGKLLLAVGGQYSADGYYFQWGDLQLEPRLVPVDGGTVELEGMDAWTFGPLPLDGNSALARDGSIVPALMTSYSSIYPGGVLTVLWQVPFATAFEFQRVGTDQYFTTARSSELEALLRGYVPGWRYTGANYFTVRASTGATEPAGRPVCRWTMAYEGGATHVYSPDAVECDALRRMPVGTFETEAAFHGFLPDPVTGACPVIGESPAVPVHRLWNGQARAIHRLVTDPALRDALVAQGWVPEGFGPTGVLFCAVSAANELF